MSRIPHPQPVIDFSLLLWFYKLMPEQSEEFGIELAQDALVGNDRYSNTLKALAVVALARAPGFFNPDLSIRDYIPEPFDVPDHIGNIAGMCLFAFPFIRGWQKASHETATTREWYEKDVRKTAKMIGAVAILANLGGELIGYGGLSTPDPIDFAYGLAGGYIYYKASKPKFLPEKDIDEIAQYDTDDIKDQLDEKDRFIIEKYSTFKDKINQLKSNLKPKPQPTKPKQKDGKKGIKPHGNKRYTPPKQKP